MTVPTLRTERLLLRGLVQEDAPVLAAELNNYEISKWLTVVPYPYTLADAEWFIGENLAGRMLARTIWRGEVFVGVMSIDKELGYWLAQDAWGQGYATEAAGAVVGHQFASTDAEAVGSSHFVENEASRNVLTKLGFVDIGPHVHFSKARDAEVPGRSMELTRARWEASQDA
ncbi:GNAT family N-acetyltransferase [Cognatiyoonia sp. IB215182]|uniref:GNAT family N-acetyltransferase n=1 Tax=Cognatiyoonia sp. IB215182 TaxID=3097353 RepID=UPI002A108143|nr:GNAT family N-acetyltransferase [Cognatiyoonia sp. IB215182]MDX8353560.1 GNAT family N-acetyltransferase [Cognatiyoonia sp. IB215182]